MAAEELRLQYLSKISEHGSEYGKDDIWHDTWMAKCESNQSASKPDPKAMR